MADLVEQIVQGGHGSGEEQLPMISQPSVHRKKGRDKSREPSHIVREKLGDIEIRLAKMKLKLIDGEEKFEELDLHLDELSTSMEEFDRVLARVRKAMDKVTLFKKTVAQGSVSSLSMFVGMIGIAQKVEVPKPNMFKGDRSAKEIDNFLYNLK